MNILFFACLDCRIYIDAGDRWAYWELEEPGIISRDEPIDVEKVLAAKKYWNPSRDEESIWLYEGVFPSLREFLRDHKTHRVVFGEEEEFAPIQSDDYFDWMQIGYRAVLTPRYFVETLAFNSWDQVRDYIESQKIPPAWWEVGRILPLMKGQSRDSSNSCGKGQLVDLQLCLVCSY